MTLLKDQLILGIESTGFAVSVGVMDRGNPKGALYLNDGSPGSQTLLATIDQLLSMLTIQKEALEGVCVAQGPGSFTSLRISLSTAEALGLGLNIPVYGVDTLRLIAATVPFYSHDVKVIQNAYKGEFYTATYSTRQGTAIEKEPLGLIPPDVFYDRLSSKDLVLGNGVNQMVEMFDLSKKNIYWNTSFHRVPSGINVIEPFLETEASLPSEIPLEPIYIRPSDAEINYTTQFKDR